MEGAVSKVRGLNIDCYKDSGVSNILMASLY